MPKVDSPTLAPFTSAGDVAEFPTTATVLGDRPLTWYLDDSAVGGDVPAADASIGAIGSRSDPPNCLRRHHQQARQVELQAHPNSSWRHIAAFGGLSPHGEIPSVPSMVFVRTSSMFSRRATAWVLLKTDITAPTGRDCPCSWKVIWCSIFLFSVLHRITIGVCRAGCHCRQSSWGYAAHPRVNH